MRRGWMRTADPALVGDGVRPAKRVRPRLKNRQAHAGEATTMPQRDQGAADLSPAEIEALFATAKAAIRRRSDR